MATNTFANQLFPGRISIQSKNTLSISPDPKITHIIINNSVTKINVIKIQTPVHEHIDKMITDQLYEWFECDELGSWIMNHAINYITIERFTRYDLLEDRYYALFRVIEKDYTFYMLKWGQ